MPSAHRVALLAPPLGLAIALAACAADPQSGPAPTSSAHARTLASLGEPTDVATGLDAPWSIAFVDGTALISERDSGRILEVLPDGDSREVGRVTASAARGEGGLLGLAVDPAAPRYLYAFSTNTENGRIERFELLGGPGTYALGEPETILASLPAASTHNGGRLAFGPDGMLYATTGDAGDRPSAQDLESLAGKVLRMTPDGDAPDDNPFADSLVYSYGHRNVQGIAWAEDGTMFASEFGQNTWDELNVIEAGGNYGWPDVEGIASVEGFVDPVQQFTPGVASPSGIAIADDTVFVAALRGERLIAVPVFEPSSSTALFVGEFGRLRDVTLTPDGVLWVLTNNTDGRGTSSAGDDRVLSVTIG